MWRKRRIRWERVGHSIKSKNIKFGVEVVDREKLCSKKGYVKRNINWEGGCLGGLMNSKFVDVKKFEKIDMFFEVILKGLGMELAKKVGLRGHLQRVSVGLEWQNHRWNS